MSVVLCRPKKQVPDIDAPTVVARMADVQTARNGATSQLPRDTRRRSHTLLPPDKNHDDAVAFVCGSGPEVAGIDATRTVYFRLEAIGERPATPPLVIRCQHLCPPRLQAGRRVLMRNFARIRAHEPTTEL